VRRAAARIGLIPSAMIVTVALRSMLVFGTTPSVLAHSILSWTCRPVLIVVARILRSDVIVTERKLISLK
jgi:hypothetical protein